MVNQVRVTKRKTDSETSPAGVEPTAPVSAAGDPLFLTCECGREATVRIATPWGLGAWCSRHAVSFLGDFPARRFAELEATRR